MDLETLLRAARDGTPGAWEALYPRLSSELRRYFLRRFDVSTSAELAQRIMSDLARQLPGFTPHEESLENYIFGIARNNARLEHRRRAKHRALGELAAQMVKTANTSPTQRIFAEQVRALLLEEVAQLPDHYRRVIEHDLENDGSIEDEELAELLGIARATVWTRRHRAIALLRDRLVARLNPPPASPANLDSTSSSSSPPT